MPKVVNHEERRREIAVAVEQVVHEQGVSEVTIRTIAKRLGCSPSIISYYFPSKLDMLVFTHKLIRSNSEQRLLKALEQGGDAISSFEMLLPTDEATWRDWHMFFAFWGLAPTEHYVTVEWAEAASEAHAIFRRIIERAQDHGAIHSRIDPAVLATKVQVAINGIASLVAQSRSQWPAQRQRATFRELFGALLVSDTP